MKIISTIAVILFIAVAALLLLSTLSLPGINFRPLVVQSGSMEPAIKTGAVVFVSPSDVYKENDIITFQRVESALDAPVTHRITEVKVVDGEYLFTTKGDANNAEDMQEVKESEVLGKVRFNIPYLGWVLDFARKPLGFAVFIIFPAVLVIIDESRKIFRELKKRKGGASTEDYGGPKQT